ncbi:MAG: MBL fold metallo-hydrolase, partial [Muribaculaceae bacterium]|nr:MBL fold metallo-hydrolase [Muribaculaceae bacterium]
MKIAKFTFSLFGINTYVAYDPATRKCAIVDPGMFDGEEEEAMDNFIKRNSLEVTHIIDTHLHVD